MNLLEHPYQQNPSSDILKCDRLLLIVGGIGIMSTIAWTSEHSNLKLAWSVASSADALVIEVDVLLRPVLDKEILMGQRLNINSILQKEAHTGYGKIGVIVCGPAGLSDDVRVKMAGLGGGGKTIFQLEVNAFSW